MVSLLQKKPIFRLHMHGPSNPVALDNIDQFNTILATFLLTHPNHPQSIKTSHFGDSIAPIQYNPPLTLRGINSLFCTTLRYLGFLVA
jgi:hypothetical protein